MVADRALLIKIHHQGLTLDVAKSIYTHNKDRYISYSSKLRQPEKITGKAIFNAFMLDCERELLNNRIVYYAACSEN